jgi:hypothetical protein
MYGDTKNIEKTLISLNYSFMNGNFILQQEEVYFLRNEA